LLHQRICKSTPIDNRAAQEEQDSSAYETQRKAGDQFEKLGRLRFVAKCFLRWLQLQVLGRRD